jgi:outer membrane protein assembly factor BamB
VFSSPAVANGVVYVGCDNRNVYALNATTGANLWSYTTGGNVESSPAVANGVVYVGSNDNNLYALNATTGANLWSYTPVGSSPAVTNGVVYVGSQDHNLYALGTTPTTLTATASATSVAVNQKFTVSGTLKTTNAPVTPVTGQPVYLEASYNAVTWFRISANKNTSSTGAYLFTGYISQSGTYYLRAHFDGTTTYAASVSTPPITVTVS